MTGTAATWRRMKHRYNLYGTKCETCRGVYFPPRIICPNCRRKGKMTDEKLSGKGKVITFSIVHAPPEGYSLEIPYVLAIIELEEGPRLTSQIVDVKPEMKPEHVYIGMPVEMAFRKLLEQNAYGLIHYGYKFRPAK